MSYRETSEVRAGLPVSAPGLQLAECLYGSSRESRKISGDVIRHLDYNSLNNRTGGHENPGWTSGDVIVHLARDIVGSICRLVIKTRIDSSK